MAQEQGNAVPIIVISGAFVVPLILAAALFFGLRTNAGATAPQPINPASGSEQSASLNSLEALANPTDYLSQNVNQLDTLLTQVTTLKANITASKAPYAALAPDKKQQALILLDKASTDISTLRATASSGQTGKADTAQGLFSSIAKLNNLLPVGGGTILDVPVVTQGHGDWCGITTADMLALYYSHGQLTSDLSADIRQEGNYFVSAKPSGNYLTEDFLAAHSPYKDWIKTTVGDLSPDRFFAVIKRSIDGGDPLILYTFNAIYSGSNHITPISGYDEQNKSIIINNSRIAGASGIGTIKNARTSMTHPPQLLTAQYVFDHRGDTFYGHTLMVRSIYLKGA